MARRRANRDEFVDSFDEREIGNILRRGATVVSTEDVDDVSLLGVLKALELLGSSEVLDAPVRLAGQIERLASAHGQGCRPNFAVTRVVVSMRIEGVAELVLGHFGPGTNLDDLGRGKKSDHLLWWCRTTAAWMQ